MSPNITTGSSQSLNIALTIYLIKSGPLTGLFSDLRLKSILELKTTLIIPRLLG